MNRIPWKRLLMFAPFVPLLMASSCTRLDLSLAPSSLSVAKGASQTVAVSLLKENLTGAFDLSASGAPTGVTVSFNPANVSASSSVMTISASAAAVAGSSTITVTAIGGGVGAVTKQLALTVIEAAVTQKPVITKFTATPATLPVGGGNVNLDWDVQNATGLELDGVAVTPIAAGSKSVTVTSNKTFTLTAKTAGETVTQTVSVSVAGPDLTPPSIVSIDPPNGSSGVKSDANIVVTFSEPMKKLETQAAYQSAVAGLKPNEVIFNWNTEGTVLTVDPNANLVYATGFDLSSVTATPYSFSLSTIATDLAGNALPTTSSNFTTLRKIATSFFSDRVLDGDVGSDGTARSGSINIYVGDDVSNVGVRGFLSFDLSSIPEAVLAADILSAQISIIKSNEIGLPFPRLQPVCTSPFCPPSTGSISVDHVNYGATLNANAYVTASLGGVGILDIPIFNSTGQVAFFETTTPNNDKSIAALEAVRDDWDNRASRAKRSQFRLSFARETDSNNAADAAFFFSGNTADAQPGLYIDYLIP